MTHISEIIENILVEWAYRVHDGMPNPKNGQHILELRESMEELNLPEKVIYEVIHNIINKDVIVEKKGDTSATTFYHEVITGIIVAGGKGPFNTGADVKKWFDGGTIKAVKGSGATPIDMKKLPQARFLEKDSIPKSSIIFSGPVGCSGGSIRVAETTFPRCRCLRTSTSILGQAYISA